MDSSINQDGRTIIFVSHNMQAIRSLCSRALLLREGKLVADGPVGEIIAEYNAAAQSVHIRDLSLRNRLNRTRGNARFIGVSMVNPAQSQSQKWAFRTGDTVEMRISYEVRAPVQSLEFSVSFTAVGTDSVISNIKETVSDRPLSAGDSGEIKLTIPGLPFRPGEMTLVLGLGSNRFVFFEDILDANVNLPHLIVESDEQDLFLRRGFVSLEYRMQHRENDTEPVTKARKEGGL
jgi:lipopolysaccharide transport system ATP-binding protein